MPWLQIKVPSTAENCDQLEDSLLDLGALSITYQDAEDNPILEPEPGKTPLWQTLYLTALFDASINTDQVIASLYQNECVEPSVSLSFEAIADQDWERAWLEHFKPMQFGERLWIVPSSYEPPDPTAVNLLLDPGLAFGTGTHPTTELCLRWLAQHNLDGCSLLDYGCGSGLLAIAAVLMGADHVAAVDIDPQALQATHSNMARNQLEATRIAVSLPDELADQTYDVLVANILAAPLKQLADEIAQKVKPGGRLVLSGLLAEQADEVSQVYEKWFTMQPATNLEEWIRLEGIRLPEDV